MQKHVAFLRAINVAGHARVTMSDLRDAFAAAGCKRVRTCIQSGNVVFESPEKSTTHIKRVRVELRGLLGAERGVFFRTIRDVERIMRGAPFGLVSSEPAVKLYVAFLSQQPGS